MIIPKAYDVEILPNFFSIGIVDVADYLKVFSDCHDDSKKKKAIPLVQKLSVVEIKKRLASVKQVKFYITPEDDSQLFTMLGYINEMRAHYNENNKAVRVDMFGYNNNRYDKLMVAALLMYATQADNTKELITKLYNTSKRIIEIQNNPDLARGDFFLNTLKKFNMPFNDVDTMTIFALNKVGSGFDKVTGNKIYFPKGLKQTSINLQWYQLLEHDLPPIGEEDYKLYWTDVRNKGLKPAQLNSLIDKWDRYVLPQWIPDIMEYNMNDIYIVCEMIRLYNNEVKLRYNISRNYGVDVLSSSRSSIADVLFTKFYSEFSGLHPKQWQGQKTERTAMAFKRIIIDDIKFKTPELQALLVDMKKVIVHSVSKDSFVREVPLGKLIYTIATGGIHTQDTPRELRSKCKSINSDSYISEKGNIIWDNLTEDSYVYVHFDISSFYPRIMVTRKVSPKHLDESVFVKLVKWIMDTRIAAKHSIEPIIDGIPKDILAEVLKIVINSIYGKLGFEYGDLMDKMAVLKVTINGQLMIMMVCEDLEINDIEVASANTDGIVVKLYKKDKEKFDAIVEAWKTATNLEADSEEYEAYINRDINNYCVREFNGKMLYKGALHPTMYANDLSKGYDMPIVAAAVVNFFIYNKPILETLYECRNILDFCKTQNVGKQYHIEFVHHGTRRSQKEVSSTHNQSSIFVDNTAGEVLQRNVRFYVSNKGGSIFKVKNAGKDRGNLAAGKKVTVLNTLDDQTIEFRNVNYTYYYEEAMKIINPIKLGISTGRKPNKDMNTASGKSLIKKYYNQFNTLFDDLPED